MVFVECPHGDDVVEGSRVEKSSAVVVAGTGDDDEARIPGELHGVVQALRAFGAAETHVDDFGAVGNRLHNRLLNGKVAAVPVGVAHLVGAYSSERGDADDAFVLGGIARRVAHRGGNGSRDVRAVPVIVHRI